MSTKKMEPQESLRNNAALEPPQFSKADPPTGNWNVPGMNPPRYPEADRFPGADWETADPAEMGCDGGLLEAAHVEIVNHYPKMLSFLVVRDGALIFERYYGGCDERTPMDLRSATKSVTATLASIAAGDGLFPGLLDERDDAVGGGGPTLEQLFPAALPKAASPLLRSTTVAELLAMTSGLYWQTGSRLGERWIYRLHRSRDWVRFALRLPVKDELRGAFLYRSVDSHLLSAAITAVTGRTAHEVARERLFAPLRICAAQEWPADPQGVSTGHIGLALTGRELAKLGWLFAAGGVWEGSRILPEAFVRRALTPQSEGMPAFGCYGWHWWIARTEGGPAVRYALGHGGQALFVVPELRLVTVFTANPKVNRWKHPLCLLERYVLPAAASSPSSIY